MSTKKTINNDNNPNNEYLNNVDYTEKVLEVKGLKKFFFVGRGKNKLVVPAVNNVTFDVYKKEVFGLVGESGSGKTTTGRTIIKLYNATEGTVDLNGVRISSGYANNIANIKKIKKKTKEAIINLDDNKRQIYMLKKETKKKVLVLEDDIKKVKEDKIKALKDINSDVFSYKESKYNLKNLYLLEIEHIKHDAKLEITRIKNQTHNKFKGEMKSELLIAKNVYLKKVEATKESAALSKDEISKRKQELKDNYIKEVQSIEEEFKPLILEEENNLLSKDLAKEQISQVKKTEQEKLANLKQKYGDDLNALVVPDEMKIKEQLAVVSQEYDQKISDIKQSIAKLYQEEKEQIAKQPVTDKSVILGFKDQIEQIKADAKQQIHEEKLKIASSKLINKSKETLHASRKMQMIFQDPSSSLNPRMTVREIISEGLVIQGGYTRDQINKKVEEVLEIVGLDKQYATRYPHEFSGGQRQRIGIARALIMDPNFIIADEPISALDVSIRAQVINLLTNLKDRLGLTILFIAHDLSVVRFFCDRIAVMFNGQIVELAASDEIFKNPTHPYTKSLLSAIPQPDPDYERGRSRTHYNPRMHNYVIDKPTHQEIAPGHIVFANNEEFVEMQKQYKKKNKN